MCTYICMCITCVVYITGGVAGGYYNNKIFTKLKPREKCVEESTEMGWVYSKKPRAGYVRGGCWIYR